MKDRNSKFDVKEFAKKLEGRTLKFAIEIIRMSAKLPNSSEGRVIKNQITKSGTSIGANYREANRARSKADFRNKIKICESEASESQYWLIIIQKMEWLNQNEITSLTKESGELLALFTSIANNTRY